MNDDLQQLSESTNKYLDQIVLKLQDWAAWLPSLGVAIVLVLATFLIARFIVSREQLFRRIAPNVLLADLLKQSVGLAIKIAGIVLALQVIGAGSLVGAILGTAGVVGLGISFAFKDIVENYIAGIILSIRQPFLKGDHIIVADVEGIVQRMTTRMTMVKSFDGNNVSIPNAHVFNSNITNFTKHPQRRFNFAIGINPEADPNYARKIGLLAMQQVNGVLDDPSPFALIDDIGDSSINLRYFGWVNQITHDFFQTRSSAISVVKDAIESEGIEIPDPSYVVKLRQLPDTVAAERAPQLEKNIDTSGAEHLISTKSKESTAVERQINEESQKNLLTNRTTE